MTHRDPVLLAVLGALHGGDCAPAGVVEAVRDSGVPGWSPTSEVVLGALETALADGLAEWRDRGQEVALTDAGVSRLRALIEQPVTAPLAPLASVLAALKLSFITALDPARRGLVVGDLSRGWRRAADDLARAPRPAGRAGWWIEHEIARCRWEAQWLEARPGIFRAGTP